uniref:Family with sequence similarity 71 member A n=1 Tax=Molossus molossus TaxID=27622 RepID=A0A7J8CQY8_MOLMO|nr:family with sequence similarity 71 member A [Molossus molossus]
MNRECLFPYYTPQSGSSAGKLQRQLDKGEYSIFKHASVFESDFIQITKRGEVIDVHNHIRMVTMGIASTSPTLPRPDVMLLARPATGLEEHAGRGKVTKGKRRTAAKTLELTRLLPLKFVQISIHDHEKQQLCLKFSTGRSCYLQLCPPPEDMEDLFTCWENLIHLLRPPVDKNNISTTPARNVTCVPISKEEARKSLAVASFQGKEYQDQISTGSLSEVAGATSAAFAGGQGVQYDSHIFTATPNTEPTELDKVSATEVAAGTTAGVLSTDITQSAVPGQLSMAIEGAATKDPGGSKTSIAIAGVANVSPKSIKMALAGAANKSSECPSNTSLSPKTSMIVVMAKAEPTSKTVGEIANDRAAEPLISTLPKEGSVSGQVGRQQRVSPARAEAHSSRRDRALRSSHHRRAIDNCHKPGGYKILQKPPGWSLAGQRHDEKEKSLSGPGGSRPVTTHKGISHAPITKDSRTSHKSGRSLSTGSSGSTTRRLSRISSFLRNIKTNLTTKTVASPRSKDVDCLAKTVGRNNMEGILETEESVQGLEMIDNTSEIMKTVTFEQLEVAEGTGAQVRIPGEPIPSFLTAV